MSDVKNTIANGKAVLGIEFGSTRIKAVLVDENNMPIASGDHDWENRLENGVWTYTLEDIWTGLQDCYQKMTEDVKEKYGVAVEKLAAIGFSAMMHGYLAFDKEGNLLVPFRTWRNTITQEASEALTKVFNFHTAALEYCASVSGNFKWRRACTAGRLLYHTGRLYSLAADRRKSTGRRKRFRHVPD